MSRGVSVPVVTMKLGDNKTIWHKNIVSAAKYIGVDRKTVIAALKSDSGLILTTDPPVYVDTALADYDVESYELKEDAEEAEEGEDV